MPSLVCSAQKCTYNDNMYCSKGEIEVGGDEADTSEETCCASFKERTGNSTANSVGSASEHIDVACEACDCKYNNEKVCHADKIGIVGASASRCEHTECGTFEN